MADCTVEEIFAYAANILGDPFQDTWTDAQLQPFFGNIWRDMIRLGKRWNLPDVERDLYAIVPAYSNRLNPSGLTNDFGEPMRMFERGNPESVDISAVADSSPIAVTTSGNHSRSTNDLVELQGVDYRLDGPWYITVTAPDSFTLNESTGLGTTFSSGKVMFSGEDFAEVRRVAEVFQSSPVSDKITAWDWENRIIFLPGATSDRQVKVTYRSSGAPPETGLLGIDDALDLLANGTAMYAAQSQDQMTLAALQRKITFGDTGQADGRGGMLRDLMLPKLTGKHWIQRVPQRFGPRTLDPARYAFLS